MIREFLDLLRKDNLQVQALEECHEMTDLCRDMVRAAVARLRHGDDQFPDVDVEALDRKVNSFERDVRRKVMTHLTLSSSPDLSAGLKLVSIVIDIERIGDYSKNIVDLARAHPGALHAGPLEERLAAFERHALDAFERSVDAFKAADEAAAREVMADYKEDVSTGYGELERALVSGDVELPARDAAAAALYVRFLKRISAHSRNLVSSLVNPFDRIGYAE